MNIYIIIELALFGSNKKKKKSAKRKPITFYFT